MKEFCSSNRGKRLKLVVVGGGPAGIGPFLAALKNGMWRQLLEAGVRVVERSSILGRGLIGDYRIRSDSFAASFLKPTNGSERLTTLLRDTSSAFDELNQHPGRPIELELVGRFQEDLGRCLVRLAKQDGADPFLMRHNAEFAQQRDDGSWAVWVQPPEPAAPFMLETQKLIIATGADSDRFGPNREGLFGEIPSAEQRQRIVFADDLFKGRADGAVVSYIGGKSTPRIVIVGGSHSALAVANYLLLHHATPDWPAGAITVLHRHPMVPTMPTPEAAKSLGWLKFGPQDICASTGRVFPLRGFRADSRNLLLAIHTNDQGQHEPRVQLHHPSRADAKDHLDRADLIVVATGYLPRALPLIDVSGDPIELNCQSHRGAPMVDGLSRVLDRTSAPIPGVFGMGLADGCPLGGSFGESSFDGKANGLSLWQCELGEAVVSEVLHERGRQWHSGRFVIGTSEH